jgi:hypothetical protein
MQSIMKDYPNIILSKYEIVELEEFIHQTVTNVIGDPVLKQTLSSLHWLQKRMHISYSYPDGFTTHLNVPNTVSIKQKDGPIISIEMELRLPSLLYPKLEELQVVIREKIEDQTRKWLIEKQKWTLDSSPHPIIRTMLHVAPPSKPIPVMARFVEDADDLLRDLGPGLTSVAHFIAVYSCKVRVFSFRWNIFGRETCHLTRMCYCLGLGWGWEIHRGCELGLRFGRSRWTYRIVGS